MCKVNTPYTYKIIKNERIGNNDEQRTKIGRGI